VFKPLSDLEIASLKSQMFGKVDQKVTFFCNNRNARRKQSGSLMHWFNEFAEKVGPQNVRLIMHTDPKDPNGQDLEAIIHNLNADDGRFLISRDKVAPEKLAMFYNVADCTVNIADAEGFGLSTLESLACGTPIIVNMTGGLQEQVTDGREYFGIGIEPASKAIIGSQQVPFIREDRVGGQDVINALEKIYSMTKDQRKYLGMKGRNHVVQNYGFDKFKKSWIDLVDSVIENYGSWETRKGYQTWEMKEIK